MAKAKSLETAFEELEAVLTRMEDKNLALEEAFSLYNDGMKLLKYCNASIDKVEKKMIVLHQAEEENDSF